MNKGIWEKIINKGDVLIYYDGPQLITYSDYLCLSVSEDSWLVTDPGIYQIVNFKKSKVDLRSIILQSSNKWLVNENTGSVVVLEGDIPEKYLPRDGYFLGI